jgi:cystathionine beta-lyase
MSSSFRLREGAGEVCYPRYFNTPNHRAVAENWRCWKKGEAALVLGSGMAALTTTLLALLSQGDHAVIQSDIYGGTYHFIVSELHRYGIQVSLIRSDEPGGFVSVLKDNTRLILLETPTNPLLTVVDLKAAARSGPEPESPDRGGQHFRQPVNQNPLLLGIDVVVHSGTKYLGATATSAAARW